MSLFRKIEWMVTLLVVIMFVGTFTISINQSRNHSAAQLQNTAENTAVLLKFNLIPNLAANNLAELKKTLGLFSNSDNFSSITVFDANNKPLVSRNYSVATTNVPMWFKHLFVLPMHDVTVPINLENKKIGSLVIKCNPAKAYQDLWNMTITICWWFSVIALLALVLGYITIKLLLLPLNILTAQAKAISNKEFIIADRLPKTKELRQLSEAMNQMAIKLQEVFEEQLSLTEKLRAQAYIDPLTNLGNRKFFNQKIKYLLSSEDEFVNGFFMLIEVKDLKNFNDRYGFQKGDELIKSIAFILEQQLPHKKLYLLSRIAGATFASLITDIDEKSLSNILRNILYTISQHLISFEINISVNIGAVAYKRKMTLSQILSGADHSLRQAQSKGSCTYWINDGDMLECQYQATQWKEIILKALNDNLISYYSQNVVSKKSEPYHEEVYIKILDQKNNLLNAATFLPEAERFGFAIDFDKAVIKHIILKILKNQPLLPYAINISNSSLYSHEFILWLYNQLASLPPLKRKYLHFEVSEAIVFNDLAYCEGLFKKWRAMGIKIGVDKAGANFFPIHYMCRLNLTYLKIDGSYVNLIEQDKDKQFFIYNLCQAANTLGINVIANNVETAIQWQVLQECQVKYGQGHYFEAPHLLGQTTQQQFLAAS